MDTYTDNTANQPQITQTNNLLDSIKGLVSPAAYSAVQGATHAQGQATQLTQAQPQWMQQQKTALNTTANTSGAITDLGGDAATAALFAKDYELNQQYTNPSMVAGGPAVSNQQYVPPGTPQPQLPITAGGDWQGFTDPGDAASAANLQFSGVTDAANRILSLLSSNSGAVNTALNQDANNYAAKIQGLTSNANLYTNLFNILQQAQTNPQNIAASVLSDIQTAPDTGDGLQGLLDKYAGKVDAKSIIDMWSQHKSISDEDLAKEYKKIGQTVPTELKPKEYKEKNPDGTVTVYTKDPNGNYTPQQTIGTKKGTKPTKVVVSKENKGLFGTGVFGQPEQDVWQYINPNTGGVETSPTYEGATSAINQLLGVTQPDTNSGWEVVK